jgi:aspartyl-tRNA(Asn)/glutamyl-tRNA(Gln) amidotransferase subunit C
MFLGRFCALKFNYMADINKKTLEHLAVLSRLHLEEDQKERFAGQITDVFDHIEMLNELDTENVKATAQVTGLLNVSREDIVEDYPNKKGLLETTEFEVDDDQIKVFKTI